MKNKEPSSKKSEKISKLSKKRKRKKLYSEKGSKIVNENKMSKENWKKKGNWTVEKSRSKIKESSRKN